MQRGLSTGIGLLIAAGLATIAAAQVSATNLTARNDDKDKLVSPSRVLSGLRAYPSDVIESLATLGAHTAWLDRSAARIRENKPLEFDSSDMPADVKTALTKLSRTPEIIVIAASYPGEMKVLRSIQTDAPEGGAQRLSQLRVGYDLATRQAATAWQKALESDPVAMGAYRELLTRFSRDMAKEQPSFATIAVTDRAYYYALLPDEAVMAFAEDQKAPDAVSRVLKAWWNDHGKPAVDAQAATPLEYSRPQDSSSTAQSVYNMTAADRKGMWHAVEDATKERDGDSLGLVPVILQPPVDQPEEARIAYAINEHARLWSMREMAEDESPSQPPATASNAPPNVFEEAKAREVPALTPGEQPLAQDTLPQPGVIAPQQLEQPTIVYRDEPVQNDVVVVEEPVYVPSVYSGYATYGAVFGYPAYCYPYASYCAPAYPYYGLGWCGPRYYPSCYVGGCYNGFYGSVGGFGFGFAWGGNNCYRYASNCGNYGGGYYRGCGYAGGRPTPYGGYGGRGGYYGNNGRYYGNSGAVNYRNNGVVRGNGNYGGTRGLYSTGQRGLYSTGNRGLYPRSDASGNARTPAGDNFRNGQAAGPRRGAAGSANNFGGNSSNTGRGGALRNLPGRGSGNGGAAQNFAPQGTRSYLDGLRSRIGTGRSGNASPQGSGSNGGRNVAPSGGSGSGGRNVAPNGGSGSGGRSFGPSRGRGGGGRSSAAPQVSRSPSSSGGRSFSAPRSSVGGSRAGSSFSGGGSRAGSSFSGGSRMGGGFRGGGGGGGMRGGGGGGARGGGGRGR